MPDKIVSNSELPASLETSDEWIRARTGVETRRIAGADQATSDFCIEAGRAAISSAGLQSSDIDLILVATCTPDYSIPGSAPSVQAALGISAGAFDINAGCAGFVTGLSVATSMVASGTARNVLLCGADTLSRVTNWNDRTTAVLFGDGGGAVVVSRCDEDRVGPFVHGCDGDRVRTLLVPAGGSRKPVDEESLANGENCIFMKGQDVYKHAVDRMAEAAVTLLDGADPDEIDLLVAHQANARIVSAVAERLGLREGQAVSNIAGYGNTSAGSIPIALSECIADGRLKPDMRVMLVAFGAGFSWAGAYLKWGLPQ